MDPDCTLPWGRGMLGTLGTCHRAADLLTGRRAGRGWQTACHLYSMAASGDEAAHGLIAKIPILMATPSSL